MHRRAWQATVHGVTKESDMTEHTDQSPSRLRVPLEPAGPSLPSTPTLFPRQPSPLPLPTLGLAGLFSMHSLWALHSPTSRSSALSSLLLTNSNSQSNLKSPKASFDHLSRLCSQNKVSAMFSHRLIHSGLRNK